MGTNYRVDRNSSEHITPLGMNSLLYLGDSYQAARRAFDEASPGRDAWNKPNDLYGVTLAVWSEGKRQYIVKCSKGFRPINEESENV